MQQTEDFLSQLEGQQYETAWFLHRQIMSYPLMQTKIRFKIPFYDRKSWICYINPLKNKTVELNFIRGQELSDYGPIFQARGRKMVKGLVLESPNSIPAELLHAVLQEAITLDEQVPYSFKKRP